REHALAHALSRTAEVVVTPGNAGIPGSLPTPPVELEADLFVIGPEQPLVDGLADRLRARGALVFGPGADGAQLEGSKAWMKQLLVDAGVPTAAHGTFTDADSAVAFLRTLDGLYVVKTDGLAAGKGVLVTTDLAEAESDVRDKLSGSAFGAAGRTVVIEEGMSGPEVSLLCLTDGHRIVALPAAQDFKRVGDGDLGPNTGGMGAYSPLPFVDARLVDAVVANCVEPTLAELRRRGIDYRGVLYAGLMLTPNGPKVLEYNARFGDPETQVVLPRLLGDVAGLLAEAASGALRTDPQVSSDAAVTVVCASEGYPTSPRYGDAISGIEAAGAIDGVTVYCAGVGRSPDGSLVTAGGRVLTVTGTGSTIAAARDRAYAGVAQINWPGMVVRHDIAAGR
ncbi:MAG: phosphoribosylamine--glycine ligase, partial [Acidimicrobiia bacterium]